MGKGIQEHRTDELEIRWIGGRTDPVRLNNPCHEVDHVVRRKDQGRVYFYTCVV